MTDTTEAVSVVVVDGARTETFDAADLDHAELLADAFAPAWRTFTKLVSAGHVDTFISSEEDLVLSFVRQGPPARTVVSSGGRRKVA